MNSGRRTAPDPTPAVHPLAAEGAARCCGPTPAERGGWPGHRRPPGTEAGFSLIELMIAVAIVGILAALGSMAYEGAVKRAHIADGLSMVAPMKILIAENFAFDADGDACSGITDITSPVGVVASSACTDDGTIATVHVVMTEKTGNVIADFISDRGTGKVWQCVGDSSTDGYRYLPTSCRN